MYRNHTSNYSRLAIGLGWFSIGLGLAEIFAPRALGRLIGVNASPTLFRLLGIREVISGVSILAQQDQPAGPVQSRVAGDAMDLALLGGALAASGPSRNRVMAATAAVAGVAALDTLCATKLHGQPRRSHDIKVKKTLTINASPEKLYSFWRNFAELPRFMNHLEAVHITGKRTSHWVAKGPAGTTVEWDAEILDDRPNEVIVWHSLDGSDVKNTGSVRFEAAPGGRGTMVRVNIMYSPPAGKLGKTVAKMFGEDPEKQISVDLLRFKQFVETGEIARTEGQPAARKHSTSRKFDDVVRT